MEPKFKKGDVLICIGGFGDVCNENERTYGGAGWKEDRILVVDSVSKHSQDGRNIYFPKGGSGVYEYALKYKIKSALSNKIKLNFK